MALLRSAEWVTTVTTRARLFVVRADCKQAGATQGGCWVVTEARRGSVDSIGRESGPAVRMLVLRGCRETKREWHRLKAFPQSVSKGGSVPVCKASWR